LMRPVANVHIVAKGTAANVVPAKVEVEAGVISPVASEVEGVLFDSQLTPGAVVKKDDVIARIDPRDVDLEIKRAQSEFEAETEKLRIANDMTELTVKMADDDFAEIERRYRLKEIPDVEFARREQERRLAKQERESVATENKRKLAVLENTLDTAKLKRTKMTIVAPFDGVVTEVFVNPRDLVTARQPLATLIPHSRLVRAKIAEKNFALVQEKQKVQVSLLGYENGKMFDATVKSKLPTAEPGTQRYSAFLDVQIDEKELMPGMTGDAGIYIDEHRDVTVVPKRAVSNGRVMVVEGGRVRSKYIDIGYRDLVKVEVTKGLAPGEQVIVKEPDEFREGQRVRVVAEN
ncbi:MAG: efflux RND transporter periplasmic adaptor subunit, partial [Opitutaceae bacterium]